jgi:hypothetical protein
MDQIADPKRSLDVGKKANHILMSGILAGLFLAFAIITVDVTHYLSRLAVFDQIELQIPEAQADRILRPHEIDCSYAWTVHRCKFDDYWRTYTIVFSDQAPDHPVAQKIIAYKRGSNSITTRLLKFLHL